MTEERKEGRGRKRKEERKDGRTVSKRMAAREHTTGMTKGRTVAAFSTAGGTNMYLTKDRKERKGKEERKGRKKGSKEGKQGREGKGRKEGRETR